MNELGKLIEDSVTSLFQQYADSNVTELMESGTFPAAMWEAFYAEGWTRVALSEESGGAGMGLKGAYFLMRIAGYYGVPLPVVESLLATHLLALAELPIPDGLLTVTLADAGTANTGDLAGIRLPLVPWARYAKAMAVVLPVDEGVRVALVDCSTLAPQQRSNMAGEPRDDVTLTSDAIIDQRDVPGLSVERVRGWLALGRAAQMAGAMQKAHEQTLEYANERKQFGRPIGKFQAIQHQIAVQAEQVYASGSAVDAALLHLDSPQEWACIAAAKITAGEAAGTVARVAHAVHGAIGFTEEYSLQLSTRRLWSWRDEYWNEKQWASKLGEQIFALEDSCLWPWLTEQTG